MFYIKIICVAKISELLFVAGFNFAELLVIVFLIVCNTKKVKSSVHAIVCPASGTIMNSVSGVI